MQQGRKERLASLLSGLAMAVLLGTLLGIPFWILGLFRVIRISGYWRAVDYVRRGRMLIVANHPCGTGSFDWTVRDFFLPERRPMVLRTPGPVGFGLRA